MQIRWAIVALLLMGVVAFASPTQAQGMPSESVTLEQALALLRDRSPRSKADRARVDVAAAERVSAGVYPNPTFSYGGVIQAHGANPGPAWEHQIVLEQPILIFRQRGARKDAADLGVRAEQAGVAADLADRSLSVRSAFAALLSSQERVKIHEECLADLARIEQIVRGRQQAGDQSLYDVARVELETTTQRVELMNAQTDVRDASGTLAALVGIPGWTPRAQGSLEPGDVSTNVEQLWSTAQRQRPSVSAARAREAAARARITVAKRERMPEPSVALGAMIAQDQYNSAIYVGVSVPLTVFDRGQGAIARATAESTVEARNLDAELAESRAELERARAVYVHRRDALQEIEQRMVERIPVLRRMAEQAYVGGNAGILDLLDTFRSIRDIRLAHVAQQESVKLAEAALIASAGLDSAASGTRSRR